MRYKVKQTLQQKNRDYGREYQYILEKMPRHMEATERQIAGSASQPAMCHNLLKLKVMVRGPQYTLRERSRGVEGIIEGRERFLRSIQILNQVQTETVACPEPLDLILTNNRDDFSLEQAELARQEPRLVTEYLEGSSLDRFGDCSGVHARESAITNPRNNYWFNRNLKRVTDQNRYDSLSGYRVANLLSRIATHCQSLIRSQVVHLDLKPEHILVLNKDEIPRLLGIGHLAPLNTRGQLAPDDPAHSFTTAGFAAPELISEGSWGEPLDGESIMLYAIGAIGLSLLFTGPRADLCELWRHSGREAIDALIQEMMAQGGQSRNTTLFGLIKQLLEVDPKRRKSSLNLDALIEQLDAIVNGASQGTELTCKRCDQVFQGDPYRAQFPYHKERFTLCPDHLKEARTSRTYIASKCRHNVTEPVGLAWAREWIGWKPLNRCKSCRT